MITPFTEDDEVNPSVLESLVERLILKGIGGLYICGTTGEGIYMSVPERKLVAKTVIQKVSQWVPVIVHAGAVAVKDTIDLSQHAKKMVHLV